MQNRLQLVGLELHDGDEMSGSDEHTNVIAPLEVRSLLGEVSLPDVLLSRMWVSQI